MTSPNNLCSVINSHGSFCPEDAYFEKFDEGKSLNTLRTGKYSHTKMLHTRTTTDSKILTSTLSYPSFSIYCNFLTLAQQDSEKKLNNVSQQQQHSKDNSPFMLATVSSSH